jgi:tripartite-type tricarboxylate transporter receptor subunit TctC
MDDRRRRCTAAGGAALLAALSAALLPAGAAAQPVRRLTILVGFAAGGAPDTVARALGEGLRGLHYQTLVENKAGAGGRLAAEALLAAPADGGTVMIAPAGVLTIYPHIHARLRYDGLKDFAPLATAGEFRFALAVGPAVPAAVKTLSDYVAWVRANPAQALYGSPGAGTAMHFIGVELARAAKVELQHVPYRGGALALADLMGGTVPCMLATLPLLIKPHLAGKLRILAHSGEQRSAAVPDVPTFKETGYPALTMSEIFVVVAAARTPAAVQDTLAAAFAAAAAAPAVKAALAAAEFDALALPPPAIAARLAASHQRWGGVVKATGYRAED